MQQRFARVFNTTGRFFILLSLGFSLYFILAFLVLSVFRVPFPYDLEWVEGSMLDQVARLLDGLPFYAAPSAEFMSFPYTPLYFYISAFVAWIIGEGLPALRLVSVLSTAAVFFTLYKLVTHETGRRSLGLLSAGLFAATVTQNAYWFDLARVDMLFLALILGGVYFLRRTKRRRGYVLAAFLLTLAIYTKQSALPVAAALGLAAFAQDRRGAVIYAACGLILSAIAFCALEYFSDGLFSYYTLDLLSGHGILHWRLTSFWINDLLKPQALPLVLSLLVIGRMIVSRKWADALFFGLLFVSMFTITFMGRIKVGGALNTLIPMHATFAILAAMFFSKPSMEGMETKKILRALPLVVAGGFLLLHLSLLIFDPSRFMPPDYGLREGKRAVDTIAGFEGEVWIPRMGWVSRLAGKKSTIHISLLADLVKDRDKISEYRKMVNVPLRRKDYSAVIIHRQAVHAIFKKALNENYYLTDKSIRTIRWQNHKGWTYADEWIWLPKVGKGQQ